MKLSEQDAYTSEDLDEAMECLIEAEAIKSNPELLKLIQAHGKKMKEGITSVEQLRSTANQMFMGKQSDQESEQDAPQEKKDNKKQKKPAIKNVADLRRAAKESKEMDQE